MTVEPPPEQQDPPPLNQQLSGLTKLLSVTRELAALHQLDDVLRAVTSGVCDALSCERASLFLYDRQRDELFTRVVTELEVEEIRSSTENGIAGWVARRRKIANIPDPRLDARWNSSIDRKTGFHTRNILAAPLVSQRDERLLGVLQLLNKKDGEFDEFDEQLLEAFASHAATALERAELLDEARRSQELQVAIDVGRRIQASFLPGELFSIPGYDVATWWQPAEQVSGDYYDVLPLPDERCGLFIADVSGHGVGPSLIMATARAMLKVLTRTDSDPDVIHDNLAEALLPDLRDGRFITFLSVALDPQRHEFEFVNAGHGPAFVLRRESDRCETLGPTTLPLGFPVDENKDAGGPVVLQPGDLLVMATDGLIELPNAQRELFGGPRLQELIRRNAGKSAGEIVAAVQKAVAEFAPGTRVPDDITLMVVKRNED